MPTLHKRSNLWIGAVVPQSRGRAVCNYGFGLRIEKDAIVGDREQAWQLVADDNNCCAETITQIDN